MLGFLSRRRRPRPLSLHSTVESSRRYPNTTHEIPTPGANKPKRFIPYMLKTWVVLGITFNMVAFAIAVEITYIISKRNNGYHVPEHNVFTFAKPSFLLSFFPTLMVHPLHLVSKLTDRAVRRYQPYVALSQGGKTIYESLTFYAPKRPKGIIRTFKRRQWVIHFSILTALASMAFQPLAGSLFSLSSFMMRTPIELKSLTTLGLNMADVNSLDAFLAAAGFVEAAAFQGLPDPPFVQSQWAFAQFAYPDNPALNTSVTVNTTGILTNSSCLSPSTTHLDTSTSNYTFTASAADGCTATANFSSPNATLQYGTAPVDPKSCNLPEDIEQQFAPVMFWFYDGSTPGQELAAGVICRPVIKVYDVRITMDLTDKILTEVTVLDDYAAPNNVSGPPPGLGGKAFNAVLFGNIPKDRFTDARAIATGSQIPGAVFRLASANSTKSLKSFFESDSGFADITTQIYTQHLSVSAKSVYFVPTTGSIPASQNSLTDRLVLDGLAAHSLAFILFICGIVGTGIHIAHRRARRNLYLTMRPGTIASTVALTAHSGFGELLYPYDDLASIRKKLGKMRFGMDSGTGAVVADVYGSEDEEGDMKVRDDGRGGHDGDGEGGERIELKELGSDKDDALDADSEGDLSAREHRHSLALPSDFAYEHEPFILPSSHPYSKRGSLVPLPGTP